MVNQSKRVSDADSLGVIAAEIELYADRSQGPDPEVLRYWAQRMRDLQQERDDLVHTLPNLEWHEG